MLFGKHGRHSEHAASHSWQQHASNPSSYRAVLCWVMSCLKCPQTPHDVVFVSLKLCLATQEDAPKHKGWLQHAAQPQKPAAAGTRDVMIPFEFKTGKPFYGHNAQVQPS